MNVILTNRDLDLIRLLNQARWLTTRQIQTNYFPNVSVNACQKRLRRLESNGYVFHARPSRTDQSFWRVGPIGIARLRTEEIPTQPISKRIPGNLQHFVTINELRLWFIRTFRDTSYRLSLFSAEWELKLGRRLTVIPDALVAIKTETKSFVIAVEVDLGTETADFFKTTKLQNYRHFDFGLSTEVSYILVIVTGRSRMKGLIRHLYGQPATEQFVVAETQQFITGNLDSATLIPLTTKTDGPVCRSFSELLTSPHCLSSREETLESASV